MSVPYWQDDDASDIADAEHTIGGHPYPRSDTRWWPDEEAWREAAWQAHVATHGRRHTGNEREDHLGTADEFTRGEL